jgi:RNA polymerase sigma-70 factor (ECF subfamily)
MSGGLASKERVEAAFRAEYGRVFAGLVRVLGDFHAAEDALQEAFAAALDTWPERGIPDRPGAWLTTAARNAASSARRHAALVEDKHREIARELLAQGDEGDIADDRLRLMFTCCHPALAEEARVALTLQTLCGLNAAAIARLFLAPEATVAQRLTRAKRKIRASGIPYEVPSAERLGERLPAVLEVVYLLFTEGYATSSGEPVVDAALCEEAIRLGRELCLLAPTHAEARGLYALMLLHHARRATRVDAAGDIVPLEEQDRSRWDRAAIDEGARQLEDALARGAAGPFQIQAAIAALHATAARADATDWPQIAALYEILWREQPVAPVALSLAFALGMAEGPERGLARLDDLAAAGALDGCERVAAARADLLRRAGRLDEARRAYEVAVANARHARERRYLRHRLAACNASSGCSP